MPTRGQNTRISGNYATPGDRGRGGIGIELDGSGQIVDNYIEDFDYGAIVYGTGFDVHNNVFAGTAFAEVLNYAKKPGQIVGNRKSGETRRMPPERRALPPL